MGSKAEMRTEGVPSGRHRSQCVSRTMERTCVPEVCTIRVPVKRISDHTSNANQFAGAPSRGQRHLKRKEWLKSDQTLVKMIEGHHGDTVQQEEQKTRASPRWVSRTMERTCVPEVLEAMSRVHPSAEPVCGRGQSWSHPGIRARDHGGI